jgi:hypothetical protein
MIPGDSYVYFVRNEALRAIKVGYSTNVIGRLSSIQTDSPVEVYLIGWIPGSERLETAIHDALWQHRMRGEWFQDNAHVNALARDLLRLPAGHLDYAKSAVTISLSRFRAQIDRRAKLAAALHEQEYPSVDVTCAYRRRPGNRFPQHRKMALKLSSIAEAE